MPGLSNYYELEILDQVFGSALVLPAVTHYLALCSVTPDDTSTGDTIVQATYTGYARAAVTNNPTNWPAAGAGIKQNGANIIFGTCTALDAVVNSFAICDASSSGNVIAYGSLTTAKTISTGDVPLFAVGGITITLD